MSDIPEILVLRPLGELNRLRARVEALEAALWEARLVTDEMVESGLGAWMIAETRPTRQIVRTILEAALRQPTPDCEDAAYPDGGKYNFRGCCE